MRIGVSNYLNAVPLARGLAEEPGVELVQLSPASLSDLLRHRQLDAALVGASECFSGRYLIIPGGAISARGPGADAVLASRVPFDHIRSIALSSASRTTNLMLKALIHLLRPGAAVSYEYRPHDTCRSLADCDACLLIGDAALECGEAAEHMYDLAEMWREVTGQPMIFTLWLVQPDAPPGVVEVILEAMRRGREQLDELIEEESAARDWETGLARRYLLDSLDYRWEAAHELALLTLGRLLYEAGLIEELCEPVYFEISAARR